MINSVYPFNTKHQEVFVRIGKITTITGIITLIFGTIFHLQGQSMVGPETSFMYSNPDWITHGIQIAIIGIIIIITGVIIIKKNESCKE